MKLNTALLSIVILAFSMPLYATNFEIEDWKLNRLFSPTFEELQSEFVDLHVTCYGQLDDVLINTALDRQFYRIQFMYFGECSEVNYEE